MPYKDPVMRRGGHLYRKKRDAINKLKEIPCMDCGVQYPPYVMDFDHRPGEVKLFNVAAVNSHSLDALLNEIEKCDLVCANCHRIRTFNYGQYEKTIGLVGGGRGGKEDR